MCDLSAKTRLECIFVLAEKGSNPLGVAREEIIKGYTCCWDDFNFMKEFGTMS